MRVTLTKDFVSWCKNDDNLITLNLNQYNALENIDSLFRESLLERGFEKRQILEMIGSILPIGYAGYGHFSQLRYILWSWPNGDKILYPLNSSGEIYIGTDNAIWSQYWPFLSKSEDSCLICNLNVYSSTFPDYGIDRDGVWLGGQSHFGHFIVNFLAPLVKNSLAIEKIRETGRIYVPSGYSGLHKELIARLVGVEGIAFHETGGLNGIYTVKRVIVPALTSSMNAVARLQGMLETKIYDRTIVNGKRLYICRNPSGDSDRLFGGMHFSQQLKYMGFTVCDPLRLSLGERLSIMGDAEWILTDSGSCSLNAYIFGNSNAIIRTLIPSSVLRSYVSTELDMLLPMLDPISRGNYIPLKSHESSKVNSFYDICIPPSIESVMNCFQGRN